MKIDRIEASKHKRGRVLVFLADGSLLKVTEQELLTFGLRAGDELDEETLRRLKEAAGVSSIKTTAADLIGRRAMSRRDLEKKLQEKGATEAEARYAGEWLEAICSHLQISKQIDLSALYRSPLFCDSLNSCHIINTIVFHCKIIST